MGACLQKTFRVSAAEIESEFVEFNGCTANVPDTLAYRTVLKTCRKNLLTINMYTL